MSARARQSLVLVGSAALVVSGVWLFGTEENPWNLFIVWMFPTTMLQLSAKKRESWVALGATAVVLVASVIGFLETLGPVVATSKGGAMICLGLVVGVMAASEVGPLGPRASEA